MKILEKFTVPTGEIMIVEGDIGKLEVVNLGDYGKEINLKCDAIGLHRKPERVRHTELLPLEEKWVITVSTQYSCAMNCTFCDVPKVKQKCENATLNDLLDQVYLSIDQHPEVMSTKRLNIHYARMGEPTWNPDVLESARILAGDAKHIRNGFKIHPVVSTMMPKKNRWLREFILQWMNIKNDVLGGEAGLQLSINSTDNAEREVMFSGNAMDLVDISWMVKNSRFPRPLGRKITLNFAVAGYTIDARLLAELFNPRDFIVKLTPMHKTHTALEDGITTCGDYTTYEPYDKIEQELKDVGFDVLVFIASEEEDMGRITCGNAILSGSKPFVMT